MGKEFKITFTISNKDKLSFVPNRFLKNEIVKKEKLHVFLWEDMENREYPKRKVLISNLIHDRESIMLYSPTGVGKTWLSLAMGMICAGGGRFDLVEWQTSASLICGWRDVGGGYSGEDEITDSFLRIR